MASISELARLYEAVFGKPPSTASTAALLRMEIAFGLAQDDPLARMLIIQLRTADQMAESLCQRTNEEKQHLKEVRRLGGELRALTSNIEDMPIMKRSRRRWSERASPYEPFHTVSIETFRKSLPMLSYFAEAFQFSNSAPHPERVCAARFDLFFAVCLALFILLCGIGIGGAMTR